MRDEVRDLRLALVRAVQAVRSVNRNQQALLLNALRWFKASVHGPPAARDALLGRGRRYLDESPVLRTSQQILAWTEETKGLARPLDSLARDEVTSWADSVAVHASRCSEEELAEAWDLAVAELVMSD